MALDLAASFTKELENPQLNITPEKRDELLEDFKLIGDHEFSDKYVTDAPDPTDIIWENRHWSDSDLFFRKLLAFTICVGLLVASFFILLEASRGGITFAATFPAVDCAVIGNQY